MGKKILRRRWGRSSKGGNGNGEGEGGRGRGEGGRGRGEGRKDLERTVLVGRRKRGAEFFVLLQIKVYHLFL
jgi:hypothetical protein